MAKKHIFIHFGGGKCGSSSLQRALSKSPNLGFKSERSREVAYWTLHGSTARKISATDYLPPGSDYFVSSSFNMKKYPLCIHSLFEPVIANMRNGLAIVSYEGFARDLYFARDSIQARCDCRLAKQVKTYGLFITRDLLPLIESSFIQWGVWDGKTILDWIKSPTPSLYHGRLAKNLIESGLDFTEVVHMNEVNILSPLIKIAEELGFKRNGELPSLAERSNERPTLETFQFLFRNRQLRPTHDPRAEFLIKSLMADVKSGSENLANFLTPDLMPQILETFRTDRELLATFLDKTAQERIREEIVSIQTSATNKITPNTDFTKVSNLAPDALFLENLSVRLVKLILDLEAQNYKLARAERLLDRMQETWIWKLARKFKRFRSWAVVKLSNLR